jgi:L-rhamnose mutarotase
VTDRLIRISIFLRDSTLFAYFEYQGEDLERDLAAISADPETQRWWKLTDPVRNPGPTGEPAATVRPGRGLASR